MGSQKHSLVISESDFTVNAPTTLPSELLQKQRHISIYLPQFYFLDHYESLTDIKKDVGIYNARANVLYLLSELISDLAILKRKKEKKKNFEEGGGEEGEEGEIIINKNNNDFTKYFTFKYNNVCYPRLEVFFEVVNDMRNEIHGFRYLIVIHDPTLQLNESLLDKIKNNPPDLKKVKDPPLDCEVAHLLGNGGIKLWVDKFVSPYLKNKPIPLDVYFYPITFNISQANLHNVFSFQSSVDEFIPRKIQHDDEDEEWEEEIDEKEQHKYMCTMQSKKENYCNQAGAITQFPTPVIRIPLEQFTPYHLAITRFPHLKTPPQRRLQLKNESHVALRQEAITKLDAAISRLRYPNLYPVEDELFINQENDEFNLLRVDVAQYKKEILELLPAHWEGTKEEWIRSQFCKSIDNHVLDQFSYIWMPGRNINQVMKSIIKWGQDNMEKMINYKHPKPIDKKLSPFANMLHYMMNTYEKAGVLHLHGVLQLTYVTALGALNADNRGIHTHMGLAGPHSGGKSYSLDHLADMLLIPGSFYKLLRLTPQSLSTGTDFSNMVLILHEIPNNYLGYNDLAPSSKNTKDQGDASVKQIMSGESNTILSAHTDTSTGKRHTIQTTINQRCVFIGAMNLAIFLMAEAIRARWFMKDIPKKNTKGRSLAYARLEKGTKSREPEFFHQMMQYLFAQVIRLIEVGIIPDVDITPALLLFNDVLQRLQNEYGFVTNEHRDLDRLSNAAKIFTIMNAIYIRYFMGDNKASFVVNADFLRIQDYLICTEEIAAFTLTALSDMFVSDTEYKIMGETLTRFAPSADKTGYLMYSLPITKYKEVEDVLGALADVIKKSLDTTHSNQVDYSKDMILNVYKCIIKRKFKDDDILTVDVNTGSIYILTEFRTFLQQGDYASLITRLIKESMEHHHLKKRRIMLGFTYSDEFPDVYKTLDLIPKKDVTKKLLTGVTLEMDADRYFLMKRLMDTGLTDPDLLDDTAASMEYEEEEEDAYATPYPQIITLAKKRKQVMTCSEMIPSSKKTH